MAKDNNWYGTGNNWEADAQKEAIVERTENSRIYFMELVANNSWIQRDDDLRMLSDRIALNIKMLDETVKQKYKK